MAFCAQNVDSIETCEHFLEINDIKYANEFGNEVIKIKNSQYKLCCLHTCEGLLQVRAAPKGLSQMLQTNLQLANEVWLGPQVSVSVSLLFV